MQRWYKTGIWAFCLVSVSALLSAAEPLATIASLIPNGKTTTSSVVIGGAPATEHLAELREAGVTLVIDLRTAPEITPGTAENVQKQAMEYQHIPVVGSRLPEQAILNQVGELLAQHANEPVVLHCASGNRAGTLWAMYRYQQGLGLEQAIDEGLASGMAAKRADWVREWAQQQH